MSRRTPFSRAVLAGAVASAVGLSAAPAHSQLVCGAHENIDKRLRDGYSEVPAGSGLAANGGVITLYTSEKGTFTIVLTRPNGMSCLMAVGENFEFIQPKTAGLDL